MKAIIKLAKSNILPVLKTVIVKNGKAFATDCDIEISMPCDIPEGVYHAEGFGLTNVKSDVTSDDLPVRMTPEGFLGGITIAVRDLKWLASAVDIKDSRKFLHGVYFDTGAAVASDGHRLNKLDCDNITQMLVPIHAIELALSMEKVGIHIDFYEKHVVLSTRNFKLIAKVSGGEYPDYRKVIPKEFKNFIQWDALSRDRIKQIKSLAKIEGGKNPVVTCGEVIRAYGREFPLKQNFPFDIGFNANYLAEVMSGVMGLNSPKDPVVVTNMDRTTVLMPYTI